MIGGWARSAALSAASALTLASGCKARAGDAAPVASSSASAAPVAALAARVKPWFSGGFVGTYEAKLAPVEVAVGAIREWKADDGKLSTGAGKLSLQVDDDGLVDGSGEGALGPSHASGKVEDDTLRVLLAPTDTTGLGGVLVATRAGDGFKGSLHASSGDSLKVRSATVELTKQSN